MKMLGNDVLTQDEFDTFHAEEFKPTVNKLSAELSEKSTKVELDNLRNELQFSKKVGLTSLVISVTAVVLLVLTKLSII